MWDYLNLRLDSIVMQKSATKKLVMNAAFLHQPWALPLTLEHCTQRSLVVHAAISQQPMHGCTLALQQASALG